MHQMGILAKASVSRRQRISVCFRDSHRINFFYHASDYVID